MPIKWNDDELLSRKEAARYLGKVNGTLEVWAAKNSPDLKPFKIGGRVYYRRSVLNEFLENSLVK